ncbi:MAG TPA: dihydrolipoyl dehydrogenase [Candidatus Kapabacteria bacterium]|jgi:dihydrolipoamide dehydrogenase|nr:dihydrolipoyl dehydrogenase [Candidatus Kapabacteria bacterium]
MASYDYDVVVLGGGPGGYPAAIRSAQLGLKTACIERDRLGGICLNWGCIPTKALLKNAEIYHTMQIAPQEWGIAYDNLRVDFGAVIKRSRDVSDRVVKGVEYLFRKNKIENVKGFGVLTGKNSIEVTGTDGAKRTITAKSIVLAMGARARQFPNLKPDGKQVLSSTEAMIMDHLPESMTIIGAGAIGMEFAYFYKTFGTKITVVEMMPNLLPIEDTEVSVEIEKIYKKQGYQIFTKHKVNGVKVEGGRTKVEIEPLDGGPKQTLDAECVLVAIGVQGNTENIGLEKLGIKMTKGFIDVDENMRSNVEGIYAVGDVAGPPWLAHVATHEGILAAEFIAGHHPLPIDYDNIPGCTYCQPQVASVGMTERAAKEAGIEYKIGKFPFTALGKARAAGETDGFVKLVIGAKYDEILGAHLIGNEATEMLEELVVARAHGATGMSIVKTIHPHPTFSEAIMEAASVAEGEAIHL